MSMAISKGVNVRISGKLQNFVNQQIGPDGLYESVSEYIRELIRQDYQQKEEAKWQWLYQQLEPGLKTNEFKKVTADEVIKRNHKKGRK